MSVPRAWVILAGGAESVALSLLEMAWRAGIPCHVLALGPSSLLAGLPGVASAASLWQPGMPYEAVREALLAALRVLRDAAGCELAVLPSEDDGLRLLNDLAPRLGGIARFSRCEALSGGGLDKAELFDALDAAGLAALAAPTLTLASPADFDRAIATLGEDAVFKPAMKPWARNLEADGMKTVVRSDAREPLRQVQARLARAWPGAERWVAQRRLQPYRGAETSACVVAASNGLLGCQVRERLKYPCAGGSAVWVSSTRERELLPAAGRIAQALRLRGLAEMTFLADEHGEPRLIELNTRPWLQVELVVRSGFPIVEESVRALFDEPPASDGTLVAERDWIQPERLVLSLLRGDAGPRLGTLRRVLRETHRPIFAVYGSGLPGARRRWIARILRRLVLRR